MNCSIVSKTFFLNVPRAYIYVTYFILANSLSRFEGLIKTRRICNEGSNTSSFITVYRWRSSRDEKKKERKKRKWETKRRDAIVRGVISIDSFEEESSMIGIIDRCQKRKHAYTRTRTHARRRRRGSIRNAALFDPWIVYCAIPPDQG